MAECAEPQTVDGLHIVGLYLPTAECQTMKAALAADPLAYPIKDVWKCLGTDGTELNNYNWKINWALFKDNRFSFQNTWAEKFKNARDASDTRPIETTYRQRAVSSDFGTFGWLTGPSPVWKASDQHIISDRWLVDAVWAHVGNNFILDFNQDELNDVQPRYEYTTGVWSRSYTRAGPYIRPTNSFDLTTSYFLPGALGGDHQLKAGVRWRPRHVTAGKGVMALLENTVPARRRPKASLAALRQVVAAAPVIRGARGEAREMAETLLARVE